MGGGPGGPGSDRGLTVPHLVLRLCAALGYLLALTLA